MTKYQVFAAGTRHEIEAVAFFQGDDLRFVNETGATVAVFTKFDWLVAVPAEAKPPVEDTSSTEKPELEGE